jgi:hypothetical protein
MLIISNEIDLAIVRQYLEIRVINPIPAIEEFEYR